MENGHALGGTQLSYCGHEGEKGEVAGVGEDIHRCCSNEWFGEEKGEFGRNGQAKRGR